MFKAKLAALAVLLTLATACTQKKGDSGNPDQRLTDYINRSFQVRAPEDKIELLTYLTGEAKVRLSAWSDEQFRSAFVESKRKLQKIAIKESKAVSPSEANITYELTYTDQTKGKEVKVTNRKFAQMVQDQGKWLIKDVRNIKELIEYTDEMSLP